jgi:hypothetical protein
MSKIRASLFILPFLASAAAAQPAAPAPRAPANLPGIWEGTIGTLPIRACFVQREWGAFGAYYYLSQMRLIPLRALEDNAAGFSEGTEDAGAGHWRIDQVDATALTARVTNDGHVAPVRLHRIPGGGEEAGACASFAFHAPRLAGAHVVRSRATLDGVSYTKLVLDAGAHFEIGMQTFALDGDSAAVRRINATLGEALAGNPPAWFGCISSSLDQGGLEGEQNDTLEPAMISRRWLSVAMQYSNSCGGPHPNEGSFYRLFDLTSGAEANPLDWFLPTAVKREHLEGSDEDSRTLEPAFRTFLLTGWHPEADAAECDEIVRSQEFWTVGLTRTGLVFSPDLPHVAQACGEEFTLTFDRLRPWLRPEAAADLRALEAEGPPPAARPAGN